MIRKMLLKVIQNGKFTIVSARELANSDWRAWIAELPVEAKREAEDLFYFIAGYVEETDEGYVTGTDDPELLARTIALLEKL